MKLILSALNLSDTASENDVVKAIQKLTGEKNRLAEVEQQLTDKTKLIDEQATKIKELEKKVSDTEEQSKKDKAIALVDSAVSAGKITAKEKDHFLKLAEADYATVKEILDAKKPYKPVSEQLNDKTETAKQFEGKSWDDLDKSGKLESFKLADPEGFKAKFKERFGVEYKG